MKYKATATGTESATEMYRAGEENKASVLYGI